MGDRLHFSSKHGVDHAFHDLLPHFFCIFWQYAVAYYFILLDIYKLQRGVLLKEKIINRRTNLQRGEAIAVSIGKQMVPDHI